MSSELILQDVKSFLMQGTSTWAGEEREEGWGGMQSVPVRLESKGSKMQPAFLEG